MKWYLNSGSSNHLHVKKFFSHKLEIHKPKSMLVIANQSDKGANRAYEIILQAEPSIKKLTNLKLFVPSEYKSGLYKVSDFDSLYIKGGLYGKWDKEVVNPSGDKFNVDLKNFLFKEKGCYFGSSLGLQILFDKFHSHMELGEEHLSAWYDHGLGIYKDVLTEVHYDEASNMQFLKQRHLQTLKEHRDIKYGVMFSGDCVIEVDSKAIMNWKILSGKYEVNKYYDEL